MGSPTTPVHEQCDGPACDEPSVAIARTGCIREHIVVAKVCKAHADRAQERANLDNLWCFECGPMGQRTRVRLRLSPASTLEEGQR